MCPGLLWPGIIKLTTFRQAPWRVLVCYIVSRERKKGTEEEEEYFQGYKQIKLNHFFEFWSWPSDSRTPTDRVANVCAASSSLFIVYLVKITLFCLRLHLASKTILSHALNLVLVFLGYEPRRVDLGNIAPRSPQRCPLPVKTEMGA